MTNVFKVKDECNTFLKLINECFEFSEQSDLTNIKCKLCNSTLIVGGDMFFIRVLVLQHLVQHLRNPDVYKQLIGKPKCFTERLQNNEFIADKNDEESLR